MYILKSNLDQVYKWHLRRRVDGAHQGLMVPLVLLAPEGMQVLLERMAALVREVNQVNVYLSRLLLIVNHHMMVTYL